MPEKLKVLTVDDRMENLVALRQVLSDLPVEIIERTNGNGALEATLGQDFSVAIVDVQMPGMDGYELAELLRGDPRTRHLPIIFLTAASGDEAQVFRGYESGAVDYIVKPYNPAVLTAKVSVLLDLHRKSIELERKVEDLAASEERFRSLVMTVPDIVYRIDPEGRFTFLNEAVAILGYRPDQLLGVHFSTVVCPDDIEQASRQRVLPRFEGRVTGPEGAPRLFDERRTGMRRTRDLEVRLLPKSGGGDIPGLPAGPDDRQIVVEVNCSGLYSNPGGQGRRVFLGTVGIIRDVSERKRMERDLESHRVRVHELVERHRTEEERNRLQQQLAQSQRLESIGTLASGVAHEINNPLNVVMNFAQLILDDSGVSDSAREFAVSIQKESDRMAKIVRNLLSFSRNDKEGHSRADLATVIATTVELIQSSIRKDDIELVLDVPEGLPQVRCRSQQIQQVLMNLLTNARDAVNARFQVHPGPRRIRVSALQLEEVRHIRVTVEDNGGGVPEKIAGRLFDPFFTTKAKDQGTGLGLSISYGIMTEHKGRLWFDSEPGRGARFHFELPLDNGWRPLPVEGHELGED
jgi:PAS domain S-box-containing protein